MAVAADSKSAASDGMWVRLPPPAPFFCALTFLQIPFAASIHAGAVEITMQKPMQKRHSSFLAKGRFNAGVRQCLKTDSRGF